MINLLPPEEKKELILEKNKKLVLVLGNILMVSLVSFILVLASLKFYILQDLSYYKNILAGSAKSYQTPDSQSYDDVIVKYNAKLLDIDTFYKKEISINDALKTLFNISRPGGLYFTNLAIERPVDTGKTKITIAGVSETRDGLLAFKSNLEGNPRVENIYFPPESWVRPANINFTITLSIRKD